MPNRASTASSSKPADQPKAAHGETPKQQAIVPSEFQHTWYTEDSDNGVQSISFTADTMIDGGTKSLIFPDNAENRADIAKSNPPDPNDHTKDNWNVGNYLASSKSLYIRNWYAKGAGIYKITSRALDGQTVPVLELSDGWAHIFNYYLTPELAAKYQGQVFSDEPSE